MTANPLTLAALSDVLTRAYSNPGPRVFMVPAHSMAVLLIEDRMRELAKDGVDRRRIKRLRRLSYRQKGFRLGPRGSLRPIR